jgi:hypothetical protein
MKIKGKKARCCVCGEKWVAKPEIIKGYYGCPSQHTGRKVLPKERVHAS